jgi:cytochrome c oxidase assembly factor CtaG
MRGAARVACGADAVAPPRGLLAAATLPCLLAASPLLLPTLAAAHASAPGGPLDLQAGHGWGYWLLGLWQAGFVLAWLGYALGAARRRAPWGRQLAFHAAMLVAGLALFGPLDDWAAQSTAMHMVQHMLLMVVVAPLAVLARPWAPWRAVLGSAADGAWRLVARLAQRPLACALLHALAVWAWHAPPLYRAALFDTGWHVLEHASFLVTAWLLWWSVLNPGRQRAVPATLALLFTLMHTGMLGAVLSFARQPLYRPGVHELADQQLAGLLMWIPGGCVYLLAVAWAGWRWLAPPVSSGAAPPAPGTMLAYAPHDTAPAPRTPDFPVGAAGGLHGGAAGHPGAVLWRAAVGGDHLVAVHAAASPAVAALARPAHAGGIADAADGAVDRGAAVRLPERGADQ